MQQLNHASFHSELLVSAYVTSAQNAVIHPFV